MNSDTKDYTNENIEYIKNKNKLDQKTLGDFDIELKKPIFEEYKKPKYQQNWAKYNISQEHEFPIFIECLTNLLEDLDVKEPKSLGRPTYKLKDIIFCGAINVYSTLSTRRVKYLLQDLRKKDIISINPSFSTLRRYLRKQSLTDKLIALIEESSTLLKNYETTFALDSTGFSSLKFKRWVHDRLDHREIQKVWIKAHICIGVKSGIVTSVKITNSNCSDMNVLPELLNRTKIRGFNILEVVADKGYNSCQNFNFIDSIGAIPFIAFRKSDRGNANGSYTWSRMYRVEKSDPDYFFNHYHQRSRVEGVFSQVKRKYLDFIRAKSNVGQVNEVLLKLLCHNLSILVRCLYFNDKLVL